MSAFVLLNLLDELGKKIKCDACRAFYLFYAASLINPMLRILESIYHMTLRLLRNLISGVKSYNFVIIYAMLLWMS